MSKELIKKDKEEGKEIPVKFKPRARLLLQLGDQLIRNESIALIELVKNSYDADASKCDIYMEHIDDPEKGIIIIEDDGFGMDLDTVINVWMEPGSDFKSDKFKNKEVTPRFKRLPIGEKGIGRFGAHKIGNQIEMTTKKDRNREVYVKIDWTIFNQYKYLEQVPVKIIEREKPSIYKDGKTGTSITISRLKNDWKRGVARNVKRSVTALVSPFETKSSFVAEFDISDKPDWFKSLLEWKDIKEYSLFNFKTTIKDKAITKFHYEFTPWASMSKLSGRKVGITDDFVKNSLELTREVDKKEEKFSLESLGIGEIIFEGYVFDRDRYVMNLGVADKTGFTKYLNYNGGIRVFRDGLRIYDYGELENDWLELDYRRFQIPSKHISNNLILGAVYLQRSDSINLIEKTNREGFIENDAYEAFKDAILHVLDIVEVLRFSDKKKVREIYGPTRKSEPVLQVLGELKEYVDKNVKGKEIRDDIVRYLIKIENDYNEINANLLKAAGAGLSLSVVIHEVEKIILEIEKVLKAENGSERARNLVKHLSSLIDGYAEIIRKSTQTNESLKEVIDQALFNIEYRLSSHKIEVIKEYKNYKGKNQTKLARSLLIGTLMNIVDNSIYWLEKSGRPKKKIYVGISDEEEGYLNIVIADNGTGFVLPTDEITEPFVSAKPGGMGLGLHIASEIMSAQKGKIGFPDWGDFDIPDEFEAGAILTLGFRV